jgi:hypothetical protein
MGLWTRGTPWRQGHVLPVDAATTLGLCDDGSAKDCLALVVSHDCDLACSPDQEANVEVIVGRCIEKVDGNFTHSKNPRRLHLEFRQSGDGLAGEFLATAKRLVSKAALADVPPRSDLELAPQDLGILQHWLAVRYRRAAFSEEFERRLTGAKLDERLAKIVGASGPHIRAIFFDLDGGKEVTRNGESDVYELDIVLLYATEHDSEKALAAASEAKSKIEMAFREKLYVPGRGWRWIELRDCMVMSDESMSVRESSLYKQWRLEHLSLREDPAQPMLDE